MARIATLADKQAIEAEMPWQRRWTARTLYEQLVETAGRVPRRRAVTFQLKSGPRDRALSVTWAELLAEVTRAANLFRRLGIGPGNAVAYVLPNCLEAPVVLLAGATAGIVAPVNPLMSAEHMAGILRETGARIVVTLAPFPRTDLPARVAEAVALAPGVETVLEVDLARYLSPPLAWVLPLFRRRGRVPHGAKVVALRRAMAAERGDRLTFAEGDDDRVCARFHTGGTTGLPKVVEHRASGILYNGWCGRICSIAETDVLMCPLPLFHVYAAYPIWMSCLMTGGEMVMPTPQGYRGDGVMDNFWKLVARHRVSFLITVPTAVAALMQRPVDADVSTLRFAISGSAAMPVETFHRFEAATGMRLLEGYGMTEATCLVSLNPPDGERKVGSVGFPFPYTDVRILHCDGAGRVLRRCATDEVGEICVRNPGVGAEIYTDPGRNAGALAEGGYLRTGDLGRIDADGYIWITGRSKDLIIRGGHNIDPALIEDALMHHPEVALAGAIGQPDAYAGELPACYVELVAGGTVDADALLAFARETIAEAAAVPRHVEILAELPKTAVGKVFKPDLRRRAIARVFDDALAGAGAGARVARVVEDPRAGLVAELDGIPDQRVAAVLGRFTTPWRWSGAA
ncbi:MAG: acyl-CoA synthetase [Amaricoccus sp.]